MSLLVTLATLAARPAAPSPPRRSSASRWHAGLVLGALLTCAPGRALATKNGAAFEGCSGCHNGGKTPTVLITPDLTTVDPGQLVNLTISVSQTNGPTAGFYIESSGVGTFSVVDSGTKLSGKGVTHTAPRTGSNGTTTFTVGWTAPATPGGVDFNVWANSANGDGRTSGDAEGDGFYSTAFGCTGTKYYHDYDGDGVGAVSSGYTIACSAPQYYSVKAGDCNDNDPKIYAGASEVCDAKDNNCDGQIDEGLAMAMYCTDADGDGHGVSGKATIMACGISKGWGLCDNDCNDNDASVFPGAPELCNNKDDNCNGQVDEGAKTVCGVGWCAKYADGCSASASTQCVPGTPRPEECNDFDDDCDGVKDNGTDLELCKVPGLVCRSGYCVTAGSGGVSGSGGSGESGGAAGGSVGSGPQPAQAGNGGAAGSSSAAQPPPPGCSLGHAPAGRRSLAALSLLTGAAAVLRRKRRRALAA